MWVEIENSVAATGGGSLEMAANDSMTLPA